jgi:hypothetical protein
MPGAGRPLDVSSSAESFPYGAGVGALKKYVVMCLIVRSTEDAGSACYYPSHVWVNVTHTYLCFFLEMIIERILICSALDTTYTIHNPRSKISCN